MKSEVGMRKWEEIEGERTERVPYSIVVVGRSMLVRLGRVQFSLEAISKKSFGPISLLVPRFKSSKY